MDDDLLAPLAPPLGKMAPPLRTATVAVGHLFLALLPTASGHGAMVHPRSRNSVDAYDALAKKTPLPITFDTGGGMNATPAGYSSLTFVDARTPRTVGLAWETSGPGQSCNGEAGAGARCQILFSVFDVPPA